MSEAFDAYYKWLAIPPEEQPADHYRLLGLKRFEPDLDVIESAADQRMAHLRNYQSGKHGPLSQKILNEVAAAKSVLLTPDKRAAYDAQLRRDLEERPLPMAAPIGSTPPLRTAQVIQSPPPAVDPAPPASNSAAPAIESPPPAPVAVAPVITPMAGGAKPASGSESGYGPSGSYAAGPAPLPRRKSPKWMLPAMISGAMAGVLALLLCGGGIYMLLQPNEEPVIVQRDDDGGPGPVDADGDDPQPPEPEPEPEPEPPPPTPEPEPEPPTPEPEPPMPAPEPEPEPPMPMPAPEPAPEPEPPQPEPPTKPGIPPAEVRSAALAKVDDVMKVGEATTDEAKLAKADEMIQFAKKSGENHGERFALLNRAAELARDAGDAAVMLRAIDQMDRAFEFDADNVRAAYLVGLARNVRLPDAVDSLVSNSEHFLDEAILRDRVDLAMTVSEELRRLVPTKGARGKSYRKQLNDRYTELRELHTAWRAVEEARQTLASNADDPSAHLQLGRYLCLNRGDFAAGVEHLAKSEDGPVRSAAEQDLAAQDNGDDKTLLAAGDAWFDLVKNEHADEGYYVRALHFYDQVVGQLTPLEKVRIEGNLETIANSETAQKLIRGAEAIASLDEDDVPMRVVASQVATLSGAGSGGVELAFMPDNKTLVTGNSDGTIKFWDIDSKQSTATYKGHDGRIQDVTVSKDGVIATIGSDQNALLWNEKGERSLLWHSQNDYLKAARFAEDGTLVVTRNDDVSFWNVATKSPKLPPLKAENSYFDSISFSKDGKMAFCGSGKVSLLGVKTPVNDPAMNSAQTAAFSPDGKLLAIAPRSGQVLLIEEGKGAPRTLDSFSSVSKLAFTPDSKTLAAAYSTQVQLLDAKTGVPWQSIDLRDFSHAMEFSPNGKFLAVAGGNGSITVWEIKRERILGPPPTEADLAVADEPGANWELRGTLEFGAVVYDAKFSPDGARLAVTDNNSVRVYDALHGMPQLSLTGHQGDVRLVAWSPDGKRIATSSSDRSTRIWDAAGGQELGQIHGSGTTRTIGFSSDGRKLLIVGDHAANYYAVPNGDTGAPLDLGSGASIASAKVAPDSSSFALAARTLTSSRPTLRLYASDQAAPQETLQEAYVLAVAPEGKHVLAYENSFELHVYAEGDKKPVANLKLSSSTQAAAFHPSQKMVALGGSDRSVSLWDATSGKLILVLAGHTSGITTVDFSSDGKSLATAGYDKTVKIWSPKKKTAEKK